MLISRGELLESRRGKRQQDNPFEDALREVMAKSYVGAPHARSPADADELVEQLIEDAETLQSTDAATKPPRKKGRRGGKAAQKGK